MKLLLTITLTISPILTQCDWNEDGILNVIDVIETVNCILNSSWDGSQCDWNEDGTLNVIDVVESVDCILNSCWGPGDGIVTDIDGNVYETITIGDQLWMAENLKVTHFNNGDEIPSGFAHSQWEYLNTSAFAVYNDYSGNAEIYGNLYNGHVIDDDRSVCPEGFHLPSDEEWTVLTDFLGGSAGSQLAGNADLWNSGDLINDIAFGTSGFLALPGGYRYTLGYFNLMSDDCYFWSSTTFDSSAAWYRRINRNNSEATRTTGNIQHGFSVRCTGDQ
ncbi:MAG: hypothetical protein HOK29_10840 [Candidatus Marinimicrobia bacterium]|nr:hypothetical protein [Candidatus Neomarinimicrobiota bacterium]